MGHYEGSRQQLTSTEDCGRANPPAARVPVGDVIGATKVMGRIWFQN